MIASQDSDYIHVVLGIIKNTKNEVLVSKRRDHAHLGGLLEFPGGKLEENETPHEALQRELKEELNIGIHRCLPLIQIPYSYPERNVLLDVYIVSDYSGVVIPNESQPLAWENIARLNCTSFPAANHGIIRALQLPNLISVTPDLNHDPNNFMLHFENVVTNEKVSIVQLRSHQLKQSQYMQLAEKCLNLCNQHCTKLVLNREVKCLDEFNFAGLHLTSKKLLSTKQRPFGKDYLVSASCHSLDEVRYASKLGLDYIFLGPVIEKNLNVGIKPLGWDNFSVLVEESLIPVYAIGGLVANDVETAVKLGGQGVAAIRGLWNC